MYFWKTIHNPYSATQENLVFSIYYWNTLLLVVYSKFSRTAYIAFRCYFKETLVWSLLHTTALFSLALYFQFLAVLAWMRNAKIFIIAVWLTWKIAFNSDRHVSLTAGKKNYIKNKFYSDYLSNICEFFSAKNCLTSTKPCFSQTYSLLSSTTKRI